MKMQKFNASEIFTSRVLPVGVFDSEDRILKVAELLLEHGISTIEITLRSAAALDCLKAVSARFPEMMTGTGSVLNTDDFKRSVDSGARFIVSPSLDMTLVKYAKDKKIIYVPGVATPTELHAALNSGNRLIKIFPASQLGGASYMRAILAPFAMNDFSIIPTGGIDENNIREYLDIPRVVACGASYVVDRTLVNNGQYQELSARIKQIVEIVSQ